MVAFYYCTIDRKDGSTEGSVFYNGTATTAPIEYLFCYITGYERMSTGTYNLTAVNTFLNDNLVA
jgi:hypothetical protein